MSGQASDRGGVGATVVVDNDRDAPILRGRDVVEGLPGHSARQRAVSDDGDRPRAIPAPMLLPRDPIDPRQRRRRVGGFDDVMLRFGARRVTRQAPRATQRGKILAPRQELVHVCLMARVEHDRVLRRTEDAVHTDREFNHAKVGPQVPSGTRDVVDEELPNLARQLIQLSGIEAAQLPRCGAARQQVARLLCSRHEHQCSSLRVSSTRQSGNLSRGIRAGGRREH